MMISRIFLICLALLAGCASYDGRGLIPGKATAAEVEQLMGPPAEKINEPAGDTVWFYPRVRDGTPTRCASRPIRRSSSA